MAHIADGGSRRIVPLVGRQAPRAVLERTLDEALRGTTRVVVVQGPAGIGKSRLAADLVGAARRRGATVLVGRCVDGSTVPFLPLMSALEPLRDELGAGAGLFDPGVSVEAVSGLGARPAEPFVAACRATVAAATRRPIVLLLEDLHWADRYTVELLDHLVTAATKPRTSAGPAMLIVVTARTLSDDLVGVTVERLRRDGVAQVLHLAGLDELELNELLTALSGGVPTRSLLSAMAAATEGNPLLARTLLERMVQSGRVEVSAGQLRGEVDAVPEARGLDHELRARIDRVNAPCRDMLTLAALLGDGGLVDDLIAATSQSERAVDDQLVEAATAGLLFDDGLRYRFDHPQLRQVLVHGTSGRRRQQIHRLLADRLEERYPDDPSRIIEIAEHLRHSGPSVDHSRLARVCRLAGDRAFAVGAWGHAARLIDDSLAAEPPDDVADRARLLLRAGIGHFRDHDLEATEQSLKPAIDDAKASGDSETWALAATLIARARMTIGGSSLGAGVDTSELEDLREAVSPTGRVAGEIAGLLAEIRFHAFDFDGAMPMLDEARRLATLNADDQLATNIELAAGLQHLGRLEVAAADRAFQSSEAHARRLADPWQILWGLGRRPLVDVMRGDLVAAATHADAAIDLAARHHDWAEHALASAGAAQAAVAQARWQAVEATTAAALQTHLRSDYPFVPMLVHPAAAAARSARGDIGGANRALDEWAASGGRGLAPYRMLVVASAGDPSALVSERTFRPVGAQSHNLLTLPVLCAQVEIGTTLEDADLLADAYEPLTALHGAGVRWSLGWPMLVARLLAGASRVLGRVDAADRWCDVAEREAAEGDAPGEAARIDLERALVVHARGDRATARELASRAAAVFDRLGMLPQLQRARRFAGDEDAAPLSVRTVLFTDLVGSTAMNVKHGDADYVDLLDRHNAILRSRLRQLDGVEIKHTGDGMSAWFASSSSACQCALGMRDDLAEHNTLHPDSPLYVRFGMASGAPIARQGDYFGISVTLAARLCDKAAPGQVLVSNDVATAVSASRLSLRRIGPLDLKGFTDPVDAFELAVGN